MSHSPLRPLQHPPVLRPAPLPAPLQPQHTGTNSSASSSTAALNQVGRADQVLHRFYLKTVTILVDGRLTHYATDSNDKKDRWFNLCLPEIDLYKNDLQIYRAMSTYPPYTQEELPSPTSDTCSIPPLLVAFILDTSDVPNGQALLWNRSGGKIALDIASLSAKGKGKEKEERRGIILERWTLRAETTPSDFPSTSQLAPHTAYRLGIIHFRALHSYIRLLPAYRLYRRLRRSNSGLRMGIKLWGPEGYPNSPEGLKEAWDVMENGLVSLDTGLEELVIGGEEVESETVEKYDFPPLDIFGNSFTLQAEYRPEVDFTTEYMEAVLSEKFVDMDEDWFTPTVAARRRSESAALVSASHTSTPDHVRAGSARKVSMPAPISSLTTTSPIPARQQAATAGSFASMGSFTRTRQSLTNAPVGAAGKKDRWGALGEGLPFAGKSPSASQNDGQAPPSPKPGSIVAARRLSAHSIQPFASVSPSTSLLRGTPPQPSYIGTHNPSQSSFTAGRQAVPASRGSSIGRTSSFLSQSGRSFTHAQLANMYIGSSSPPVTGAMSDEHAPASPLPPGQQGSPSSLTFAKQPVRASSYSAGRGLSMTPGSVGSPFIPGSYERDRERDMVPPQILKRYSSSISSRPGSLPQRSGLSIPGSQGTTPEPSLPSSFGHAGGSLRRTSTRESGLRHSVEPPARRAKVVDEDDIQAFLRALDAAPQPPSRPHIAGSRYTSLGSSHSRELMSPLSTSAQTPARPQSQTREGGYGGRVPMTKAWVDDELKRMAGSSSGDLPIPSQPPTRAGSKENSGGNTTTTSSSSRASVAASASASLSGTPGSIGLLSASRPTSTNRRGPVANNPAEGQRQGQGARQRLSGAGSPLSQGLTLTPSVVPENRDGMEGRLSSSPLRAVASNADQDTPRPLYISAPADEGTGAKSLPGSVTSGKESEQGEIPLRSAGAGVSYAGKSGLQTPSSVWATLLSPQTTGGTSAADSPSASRTPRRGPVLLRGGFENRSSAASTPSHSPVRDYARAGVAVNAAASGPGTGLGINTPREVRAGSMPVKPGEGMDIGRRGSRSNYTSAVLPSTIGVGGLGRMRSASGSGQGASGIGRAGPGSLGRNDHGRHQHHGRDREREREGEVMQKRRSGSDGQTVTAHAEESEDDEERGETLAGHMSGLGFE